MKPLCKVCHGKHWGYEPHVWGASGQLEADEPHVRGKAPIRKPDAKPAKTSSVKGSDVRLANADAPALIRAGSRLSGSQADTSRPEVHGSVAEETEVERLKAQLERIRAQTRARVRRYREKKGR